MKIESSLNSLARAYESHKYHRAAIDGYVDMLCEASKKDTNLASEENGLTPTLLAALNGQLEALRILVGRGGDPEKSSPNGSNALHLAASRNHLNCVSFLVNFGVNMWALDNELHTAKDVAAIEQRKEVLDYLDQMMAKQSALNTKNVQKLKEKAKVAAEKRLKTLRKQQLKAIKQVERDERILVKLSTNRRLLKAAHSISDIKLVGKSPNGGEPTGRLVGAQSIGNLASLRTLSFDPLNTRFITGKPPSEPKFRPLGSSTQAAKNSSDIESAYASSLSSSSDYVTLPASPNCSSTLANKKQTGRPKYSDLVALKKEKLYDSSSGDSQKANSIKSNSTISARLRSISGISRKVHLKRMLLSGASSTSNLSRTNKDATKKVVDSTISGQADNCSGERLADSSQQEERREDRTDAKQLNWPACSAPGSQLSRAVSQPDFVKAQAAEENASNRTGNPETTSQAQRDPQRHQLLTQCLSQLKMQHEAIYSGRHASQADAEQEPAGSNGEIPKPPLLTGLIANKISSSPNGPVDGRVPATFSNTDELIQHQLTAGQFPIRPSVIKQQQQQRLAIGEQQRGAPNGHQLRPTAARSTTIVSVDSIGSASSFAKRNSRSSISGEPFSEVSSSSSSMSAYSMTTSGQPETKQQQQQQAVPLAECYADLDGDRAEEIQETIDGFLLMNGLFELSEIFATERIDLEALMLLDEHDFRSLNILLGPRRKLMRAIEDRRAAMSSESRKLKPAPHNTNPGYYMVDTQL